MTYNQEQELFIDSYKAVREELNNAQKGILFDLLVDYLDEDGSTKTDDQLVKFAYRFIANRVRKVVVRYTSMCEKNRANANKRWERERARRNA